MNSEEIVWEALLSRQPDQIRAAFKSIDKETQAAVLEHLRLMVSEEGWHPEQVKSAQAALDILASAASPDKKNRKGKA